MRPARTYPARRDGVRLLLVDPRVTADGLHETTIAALPRLLDAADLLVVNDAATLPASLRGCDSVGRPIELRLLGPDRDGVFPAALFGAGDWRQRTEDRPPPPALTVGARLTFGSLGAQVLATGPLSPRQLAVRFDRQGDALWAALYRHGRPVQYSHLDHALPLWAVQTVYASRPWSVEMPSAGLPLSWEILLGLRRRGVRWAALTHAAGLSATGDPALDAALPLPERYEIPAATVDAVAETRRRGGRVVAVGTTVVRALEGAAAAHHGRLPAGAGVTDLRLSAAHRPLIVDGVLSGTHAATETHFHLLAAFAGSALLSAAVAFATARDFTTHELGDAMLVLPGSRESFFCGKRRVEFNYRHVSASRPETAACAAPLDRAGDAQLGVAHV
ncbi:MAG TPA: S-adenosylmethionine:tRNA ribosyltransferase-isomerase [Polyangia bacterium]|jgi:S-adenosylmethionine:tRNA ribosyltransferase-isomerase